MAQVLEFPDGKLFQETLADDPWKVGVGCIVCNRTTGRMVGRLLPFFFDLWPTPEALFGDYCPHVLAGLLRPAGFQNQKARRILDYTTWYLGAQGGSPPGLGKYGQDSVAIFCRKDLTVEPTDHALRAYIERHREN